MLTLVASHTILNPLHVTRAEVGATDDARPPRRQRAHSVRLEVVKSVDCQKISPVRRQGSE